MTIHHATVKKAEKIGVILTEINGYPAFPDALDCPHGTTQAYWPKFNVYAFGAGEKPAQAALAEMDALQAIKTALPESSIVNLPADPFLVLVYSDHNRTKVLDRNGTTPKDALLLINDSNTAWHSTECPADGGEAYAAGFMAGDNPHDEDSDEAALWDDQWDAAADAANDEGDEPEMGGSVVKSHYRTKYAEEGHPNHCGDWLAVTLNNLVQGKTATDLERFESICEVNGVSLAKYNRTTNGWQGRLRMTGRNLLVKKVYLAGGVLSLPAGMFPELGDSLKAPGDWMAGQRVKAPKAAAE